jgi:hypothetical protein
VKTDQVWYCETERAVRDSKGRPSRQPVIVHGTQRQHHVAEGPRQEALGDEFRAAARSAVHATQSGMSYQDRLRAFL